MNAFFRELSRRFKQNIVGFIDAGYYRVTDTVYIPPNCRIVGEAMSSVIMAAGAKFSDIDSPRPVVLVGKPGEQGYIEWSDTIVSTQGNTAGATLIVYNLSPLVGSSECLDANPPSGM